MDQLKVLRSVRILIVEDSPSDVRLVREALRASEFIVRLSVCKDGVEALEYLHHCKSGQSPLPDLILLDLNLPLKSGHEVLNEIKHDPQLKKIPVLIMTSSGRRERSRGGLRFKCQLLHSQACRSAGIRKGSPRHRRFLADDRHPPGNLQPLGHPAGRHNGTGNSIH